MDPDALVTELAERFGAGGLDRVVECLDVLAGRAAARYQDDDQEPTRLFFPEISAQAWHDPAAFEWVPRIEDAYDGIRAELLGLRQQDVPFVPYEDAYTKELGWTGWDTYSLYRGGQWRDQALQQCPRTVAALSATPHGPRDGMFTVLNPGSEITAHTGGVNLLLTCHLALIVPADCGISVAGDVRGWQEGRCLIFDDSFVHEAWNRGQQWRSVLLWDIWHPELTDVEVQALTYLLPRLHEYLRSV